jgi:hypothetical protein
MNNRLLLILFLLAFNLSSIAQNYEYKVLSQKGNVNVQRKNTTKWIKVKIGDFLLANDKIKLENNSYVGLTHNSGKIIDLNKAGVYSTSDLNTKLESKKKNTITGKFVKYVSEQIDNTGGIFASKSQTDNMKSTGAVNRSLELNAQESQKISNMTGLDGKTSSAVGAVANLIFPSDDKRIKVFLPRTSYLFDDEINFTWYKDAEAVNYTIYILDRNDVVVYKNMTNDTNITINIKNTNLQTGTNYYWFVESGNKKSDQYNIYWLTQSEKSNINTDIVAIYNEVGDDDTPLRSLILAAFYEDLNIQERALNSYKKALNMAQNPDEYKRMYGRYLAQIGLFERAKQVFDSIQNSK